MLLPPHWRLFDLDEKTRDRSIERVVKQMFGRSDELARFRREATLAYRSFASEVAEQGCFLAANYAEEVNGIPLTASLLVFLMPTPLDHAGTPITSVGELRAGLARDVGGEEKLDVEAIALAVGDGVRVRVLVETEERASDGTHPKIYVVRYFVPVADTGQMLVITFSTAIASIGDAFSEIFDAIASSATWTDNSSVTPVRASQ